ncbi:MAG: 50S ribosomal protein L21 [Gemmatimonadota bacterium]
MYAVFRTGGKQFRAEPGATLRVPTLDAEPGDSVTFDDVLVASNGDSVSVGTPVVSGASVKAEVIGHGRDKKIIVFKRKRRKGYRKKQGHRQGFTEIRVDSVAL